MEGKKKKKEKKDFETRSKSSLPDGFPPVRPEIFLRFRTGIRSSHGGIKFLRRASGNDRVYLWKFET